MQDVTSGAVKKAFNYSINEINRQKPKTGADVEAQIDTVFRKVCRFSQAEIITPQRVARKMIDLLPDDIFESDGKVLDIASKQGEFAFALLKRYGDGVKDRIYSLPTSSLTYEVVRRVYQLLGMPVENILFEREGKPNFTTQLIYTKDPELQESKQELLNTLKDMNFGTIAGNPPYNLEDASGGSNDAPIFQDVTNAAFNNTGRHSVMITPSKWFSGGRKNLLDDFRRRMLTCGHIRNLSAFSDAGNVFDKVEIKGGVCIFYFDNSYVGKCEYRLHQSGDVISSSVNLGASDILIRNPQIQTIVEKIDKKRKELNLETVQTVISADTPFGIPTNPATSKKHPIAIFTRATPKHNVKLYYWEKGKRKECYVAREDLRKNAQDIDKVKVFIPKAGGTGNDPLVLGKPILAPANSVCSQTFLYAAFNSDEEAKAFEKYVQTRFVRFLISSVKITQDVMSKEYRFVPLEDLSSTNTHIDWTKSVEEIDKKLFDKYGLTQPEREFIKSMIKPM